MAMHLGHIIPSWSTPILFHKSAIVPEWERLTVHLRIWSNAMYVSEDQDRLKSKIHKNYAEFWSRFM